MLKHVALVRPHAITQEEGEPPGEPDVRRDGAGGLLDSTGDLPQILVGVRRDEDASGIVGERGVDDRLRLQRSWRDPVSSVRLL
jgi:hypothetical protein